MNRSRRYRMPLAIGAAAAVAVVAGAVALRAVVTTRVDPGVRACQMMNDDRRAGIEPDSVRSEVELDAMARSRNPDLRYAAAALSSDDMDVQFKALPAVYRGCATVGMPLS